MTWDYAQLSHTASQAGGPKALVNQIYSNGRKSGHIDMIPYLFLAMASGALIYKGIETISDCVKTYREVNKSQAEEAMCALEQEIETYSSVD